MKDRKEQVTVGAYHFINYDKKNLTEFINKISEKNSVICFDLEDSIQDLKDFQNNASVKNYHRDLLRNYFYEHPDLKDISLGIRINASGSIENKRDIGLLEDLKDKRYFKSIFLTKVEDKNEIKDLEKQLEMNKINYEEIIAVTETKKGLKNLSEILSHTSGKFRKITFGHCDFNLDNEIFPFYHQCSQTYWDWLKFILFAMENSGNKTIEFVNSPYLELGNAKGFESMLSKLKSLCNNNFYQVTLTHRQTLLCKDFSNSGKEGIPRREQKNCIKEYARKIVRDFENQKELKAFVIDESRTLISPHEYKAAVNYLNAN